MTREIRVLDAARPDRVVLTIQEGDNQSPAWRDSRRLSFGSNREGLQKIYIVSVDQKRPPVPLFTADGTVARNPASWARRLLALYEIEPARGRNVLVYRIGESVAPVAATGANERSPSVSPDGRWISYVSDASGRDEVYVARLDRAGEPMQMTRGGAFEPVWAREGLFYREGESVVLRALEGGGLGEPRTVFEGHYERDPGANLASYDVDPQGRFFIMLKSASQPREPPVDDRRCARIVGRHRWRACEFRLAILIRHQPFLAHVARAPNLIMDVRGNGGGSTPRNDRVGTRGGRAALQRHPQPH